MVDMQDHHSTSLVTFAKVIADETRQQIMNLLCCDELCVNDIVMAMARQGHEISQPTVSHHLGVLRQAGMVTVRYAGRQTYYSLDQGQVTACCGVLLQRFAPGQEILPLSTKAVHET